MGSARHRPSSVTVVATRLRINYGGALEAGQVVGREFDLATIKERLLEQSVLLVAERRVGKTSLLTLLRARPPEGSLVLKLSVEGVTAPDELVRRVAQESRGALPVKLRDRLHGVLDEFGITGLGPVTISSAAMGEWRWKEALRQIVQQLLDEHPLVIIVLDEFPYMLDNVRRAGGPDVARHILDSLRELRQEVPRLRFLMCGSIGLHHVLRELRDGSWAPINDLAVCSVGPLSDEDAVYLATALLRNEGIDCQGKEDDVGQEIARATENVPYYIHGVAAALKRIVGRIVVPADAHIVVSATIEDPDDPWGLRHLEERVHDYYGDRCQAALQILDHIAMSERAPLSELRSLTDVTPIGDRHLRALMDDMQRDHYLVQTRGVFAFRLGILRIAWISIRYLELP
jgi:hypothetical protein